MSYKIRNSIVLGVFFLLVSIAGFVYWNVIQPKRLDAARNEIADIERELQELPQTIELVKQLTEQYFDTKRKYDSRSKVIPAIDITSQTYSYMSQGIDQAGFLKFNMRFEGSRQFTNWGYNIYRLEEGEATFRNLYKFIYYLENGQRLYKIASMSLDQREEVEEETKQTRKWVAFSMEVHAYYTRVAELNSSLAAKALPLIPAPFDPFNPIILTAIASEGPAGAIDVNQVEVMAVLPGKAFVLFEGELLVLQLGDRVWRGYVSVISPQESKVVFTLDEGGIVRRVERRILFEK